MLATLDIGYWARTSGLEILLIALGAVLATRLAHWLAAVFTRQIERRVKAQMDEGLVPSEEVKHMRVVVQACEWACVVLIYFLAGLLVLLRFQLPIATLVAPATVVGVALGFGAQRIVQDLLAGFFLFAERQYGFGDVVRVSQPGQTTGVSGTVEELTLRTTRLRTVNGELVIIPNGQILQATNLSRGWSRVVVDVPLSPDQDVERATDILREVAGGIMEDEEWSALLLETPTVTGIEAIQVGYLQLRLMARTLPAKQWDVGREIRRRVIMAFNQAGITPPKALFSTTGATGA